MFLFRRKIILIDIGILFLCGLVAFYFFFTESKKQSISTQPSPNPSQQTIPTSKVWQIALSFHPQNGSLSVQHVTISNGKASASPFTNSPYKLIVLDTNQHVVFQTSIPIAEQILYDVYFPPGATPSGLAQPDHVDNLVTIPYFQDAKIIQIIKNDQKILEFAPPKEISFNLTNVIQSAFAATSCDLLHIVFISDGYTDMTKFHADAQRAEATFTSKQPFASVPNIFDFKVVDNSASNSLGCFQSGQLNVNCVVSNASLTKVTNAVYAAYPQLPQDPTYTKIIILVDGAPQRMGGGLILGVANTLGGQFGVFQNRMYFETTATMEVLGHDVSQLYDRYLYSPSPPGQRTAADFGNGLQPPYVSNCTTNPNGESFWKNAGVNQGYKGCTSQYMYAPAQLDCGSQGSHSTIMSAAGCAGPQFDGVEQYYIKSQILPKYCGAPTPTPTFTPTPTIAPKTTNSLTQPPVPTFQSFKCEPDPKCSSSKSQQLCALKCTPQ